MKIETDRKSKIYFETLKIFLFKIQSQISVIVNPKLYYFKVNR